MENLREIDPCTGGYTTSGIPIFTALPKTNTSREKSNNLKPENFWQFFLSEDSLAPSELVAAAIHQGHHIEQDVESQFLIDGGERLVEEDPYTNEFTVAGSVRIIVNLSRFQVDLNRPREKAIYFSPEDAWGLKVYKAPLSEYLIQRSLEYYDTFYKEIHTLFSGLIKQCGKIFIYDFHSYNYRRAGSDKPPADPEENPDINIGTGNIDRAYWSNVVEKFISDLKEFNYDGRSLDVRENVNFKGGYFSKWISDNFPHTACVLAVEVKKFFMDEWTGVPDWHQIELLKQAFLSTRSGIVDELKKVGAAV